jgi:hypothetical protein
MDKSNNKRGSNLLFIVIIILLLLFIILSILLFYDYNSQKTTAPTGNVVSSEKAGSENIYPNPELTLGAVMTIDKSIVCVTGYTSTVRDVSVSLKKKVYAEYNTQYPQTKGSYEVDHFIPLELGGSNDLTNLWLEPAEPRPGFHEKDKVENYLHDQVCNHNMSLIEAQNEIKNDWYSVYLKIN